MQDNNVLTLRRIKMNNLKRFVTEEEGMGTVELVLIIVVLIALVLLFKTTIVKFVGDVLGRITNKGGQVMSD
jgi:Flp pilus assembly pilin Flp